MKLLSLGFGDLAELPLVCGLVGPCVLLRIATLIKSVRRCRSPDYGQSGGVEDRSALANCVFDLCHPDRNATLPTLGSESLGRVRRQHRQDILKPEASNSELPIFFF
jgi:hypothetical protein